ncbi:S1/P1 Nuclease [Echinicola marina]|uniref:zinc dependent phospholipase C family protein n=1 Tax=Echinicola marina TaxID=2859768 RepID=UPI001CF63D87|nr:zinc dependent phospholipase C family protein [Echinicola marina]UCS93491.1 S1/P1 Nuclease [Echinicola marina]
MKRILFFLIIFLIDFQSFGYWGFYAHKKINQLAVFSLPYEMLGFYKENILYITENAVNPDKRRYAIKGEAEKHYIDADIYGDSAIHKLPRYWKQAVELIGEDSLRKYGIAPWNVDQVKQSLTEAFKDKNAEAILRLSADLGHYIGDINVPLHTTENYNGQLTDQYGIHGFWESRIPELLAEDFELFVGKAYYIENTQLAAWQAVIYAHAALDSVLTFEKTLSQKFNSDKKYSFEERGSINTRVYSKEFTMAYNDLLAGQVERQMKRSIIMVASFWFTAWVDAGQPNLSSLSHQKIPFEQLPPTSPNIKQNRTHEH